MKNLSGEEVKYLNIQGPYQTVLKVEQTSAQEAEVSFTVEGQFDYSGKNRVTRAKWLLTTFRKVRETNPHFAFIAEPYCGDSEGLVRLKAFKKVGFQETGDIIECMQMYLPPLHVLPPLPPPSPPPISHVKAAVVAALSLVVIAATAVAAINHFSSSSEEETDRLPSGVMKVAPIPKGMEPSGVGDCKGYDCF